ncbi:MULTISPECIES: hypothetical protein [Bacillaceae]|uniref:Lipoprotein n=1 Tax=Oceanobacillus caeni TaxID=405946 RepID=A0ABR5MI97_9BACI|nr:MULTISPECIES: hypothetical protein [Bacillaceae]KPH73954.1 hypothetical protein AFL42_11085 [Oceanobacillus caeni]
MKKTFMYTALGIVGAAIGVIAVQCYLKGYQNSDRDSNSTFENAGVPDQSPIVNETQLENSKMVSEGSQFGVHYYNENKND